ncbi:MAG: nucleoside deaminase [Tepidiformaceae bacterium]
MRFETDEQSMHAAIEEARAASAAGDLPFGAVVVRDGRIIGRGRATDHTTGDVTDHAEMLALRAACKAAGTNNLADCTIVCTSEPCNMCAAAIFQAMIPRVVMGASRSELRAHLRARKLGIDDLAADSGYAITLRRGVLRDAVLELFAGVPGS